MKDQSGIGEHLQRTARDLVSQFTAVELMHDYRALRELGSGVLWIDLATGQTRHNGRSVPPLVVGSTLQAWLRGSLAQANISRTTAKDAALTARLALERYKGQRGEGKWVGQPTRFVGCQAEVRCRLAVEGHVVEAHATQAMEWPDEGLL